MALSGTSPSARCSGQGGADQRVEQLVAGGAVQHLYFAVGQDQRQRWLGRHVEGGEDFGIVVADLGERQPVLVDERLIRVFVAAPGDADEFGLTGPTLCCFLDRGSFSITGASPWGPEPQQNRSPGKCDELDVAAPDQRSRQLERLGHVGGRCRTVVRGSCHRCSRGGCRRCLCWRCVGRCGRRRLGRAGRRCGL